MERQADWILCAKSGTWEENPDIANEPATTLHVELKFCVIHSY